ncbi:MAG: hypothetical protein ABI183_17545 [Polyangiaceae bacterium]
MRFFLFAAFAPRARLWFGFVFLAAFFFVDRTAFAGPKEDLDKAEQSYANLDYEAANKTAQSVVKQHGLSHSELVRAYRIIGVTHAILDHDDAAQAAFVMLLTYEPDYQADQNLGPKVTTPFFEARGFWRGQPVKPGIDATATVHAKGAGSLKATIRDPSHIVKRAEVGYRWGGVGPFKTKALSAGEQVNIDIAEAPSGTTRFDYYVQAFDDKDNAVLESGNATTPKTVTVQVEQTHAAVVVGDDKKKSSIVSSPGFWAVVGGVVAVGAAVTIFALARPKDEPTSASLTPSLNCGSAPCN